MIAIVDYGVGNLFSLRASLDAIGADCIITGDAEELATADRIIMPGVGAFADAVEKLRSRGLDEAVKAEAKKGKPLMGICLGMQMLFDTSFEYGHHVGLGLIHGSVVPMEGVVPPELKIPHIGWNALHFKDTSCPLFKYVKQNECVYFVHSYYASDCADAIVATAEYGIEITAAVAENNIYGCQFHPEKSGETGLNILRAFCEIGENNI